MRKKKTVRKSTHVREILPLEWDLPRLRKLLDAFSSRRIIVIGDVGVDRYTHGAVERISPEAPVPIVRVEMEQLKLGLAANVADNVRALRGEPRLIGVVGTDRSAQDFRKLLRAARVSPSRLIVERGRRTALKERIVSDRQQLLRVDYESITPVSDGTRRRIFQQFKNALPGAHAVVVEDYAKGMLGQELMRDLFAMAQRHGLRISVDPNARTPLEHYHGASVLTPNTKEAEALAGFAIRDEDSLLRAGRLILNKTAAEHVVMTRGKEGMAIFSQGESSVCLIPTYAREVYDVSGAGDTVIAVLSLALSAGATIEESSILGNLAAGVEVAKRGTATVSPSEVRVALEFFAAQTR